jgi:uncharacterized protein with GYD domain
MKEVCMSKYMLMASLKPEAVQGIMKEGGVGRKNYIENFIKEAGGTLESFYYAFGETDVFVVADMPDVPTVTAFAMAVNSSGLVSVKTIPLITPEEVDAATKKRIKYRAPGK